MKMDKFGYWIIDTVAKPLVEQVMTEAKSTDVLDTELEEQTYTSEKAKKFSEVHPLHGSCALSIRFENHGEYLRWKKYFGSGRQWDFIVSYPAVMRAVYEFSNSLEVEVMAKKVVQLLEAGFNVYSASWTLDEGEKSDGYQEDI